MITSILFAALIQVAPSRWTIEDSTSPLDNRRTYAAGIESETPLLNSIGRETKASLLLTCINGRRQVVLGWPTYLGHGTARVTWKIGDGEARRQEFGIAGSGTTAIIAGREARRFLTEAEAEGALIVRVTSYADEQEATFDLTGAREVLSAVDVACPAGRVLARYSVASPLSASRVRLP